MVLSGCSLPRADDSAGDIAEFVPPPPEESAPASPPAAEAAEAVEVTLSPEAAEAIRPLETARASGELVEANTIIRFQPVTQQLNVGDTSNVEIWVDNAVDLVAVDVQVGFDPNVLQVQDFDPGQEGNQIQLGNFVSPDFIIRNQADNSAGQISISFAQLAPTPPASGGGWLATIPFEATGQGTSQWTFSLAELATGNGQFLAVTSQPGQVIVAVPNGSPTPVITPSPTFTLVPGQPTPTPTSTPIPGVDTPTPTLTPLPPPPSPTPTFTPLPPPTSTPVPLADVPVIKLPPNPTFGFCYRVQGGDTLHSLGQQFGIDPGFINLANDLYPPGHIFIHQGLFIPQTHGSGPNVYRVQLGDTLAQIAENCHLPVDFLAQVNRLEVDEPLVLQAGETVRLEDGSTITLEDPMIRIEVLLIPIPPFPPPSRYHYPGSVFPPVAPGPPPQPPLPPPPPPPRPHPCQPPSYCGH
jgi:LysM repeat protein